MSGTGGNGAVAGGGRDWLSRTLHDLRKDAGVTGFTAGAAIGKSQSRISRIEAGRHLPSAEEVRKLCTLYKAPPATRRELLKAVANLQGGTYPARVVMSRGNARKMQLRIREAEAQAGEIWNYQPAIIPGLLQTPAYMRLVFSEGGDLTPDDVEDSIKHRAARGSAMSSGRAITVIMTEGPLRWQAGSAAVMAEQLDHIAAGITSWPANVRVGVIPQASAVRVFPTHGFSVYDQRVAVVGVRTGTTFMDSPADVAEYVKLFGELESLAVFGSEAAEVIGRVAAEYRKIGD